MIKSFDFYFDFISPYSFLAHKEIIGIEKKNSIKIRYKPILLGGLHNLHGIKPPAFIQAKAKHMVRDCKLIAEKNNIKFIPVLQPTAFTSKSKKDYLSLNSELQIQYEIIYKLIKKKLDKINFDYLNLENSLDKQENYFIDFCHLSPNGNMIVARDIFNSKFFEN